MKDEGSRQSPARKGDPKQADLTSPGPPLTSPDQPSDEALESLERLQALGGAPRPRPRAAAPVRRPKMPSVSRGGLSWPRIVAPVVFLAAVLIVFSFAVQSGVVGGSKPTKPVAKVTTKTKATPSSGAASTYKVYVVKSGDSLSMIAAKFNTTVTDIQDLNPKADLTTLLPGQKIKVPR